jgi:FKBP-type peptidyl-prolyl cis-trans isomerase
MQQAEGGLRWRFLRKTGEQRLPCGTNSIFQVSLTPVDEKGHPGADTLIIVESTGSFFGADWRKLLAELSPGDSVLLEMPVDSVTFMRSYLEKFQHHEKVKATLVVRQCQDAEVFFEEKERYNESMRIKAYLEFDSIVRRWKDGKLVGRGALIAWSQGGKGRFFRFGDPVRVYMLITTLRGESFYQSPARGDTLEVYDGSFVLGLHEALTGLKAGDTACIYLPYFLAFGEEGNRPYVKPFQNICILIRAQPLWSTQP